MRNCKPFLEVKRMARLEELFSAAIRICGMSI